MYHACRYCTSVGVVEPISDIHALVRHMDGKMDPTVIPVGAPYLPVGSMCLLSVYV